MFDRCAGYYLFCNYVNQCRFSRQFLKHLLVESKQGKVEFKKTKSCHSNISLFYPRLKFCRLIHSFEAKPFKLHSSPLETLLKFFPVASYRNLTLQCLTEVAALQFGEYYDMQYVKMYTVFMVQLLTILPPGTNIQMPMLMAPAKIRSAGAAKIEVESKTCGVCYFFATF
uniref:Uncharacterized protein n=1 Tax=Ananas comosus var. bracteatus TaxID=296719 RepID=A0A6V7NF23_ANACO|nr:unnamed protein product [Ananas comosus var. bracteatus]